MTKDDKKSPPPIPNFSPEEQLRKEEESRLAKFNSQIPNVPPPMTPHQYKLNEARLSSIDFNEEEIQTIRQATIKAFRDDLSYEASDKNHKIFNFRSPTQGAQDIIKSISGVLLKKKPKIELDDATQQELVTHIDSVYKIYRNNYKDTHLTGVSKNTLEKAKTFVAMVKRMIEVVLGAVAVVIGVPICYLGQSIINKGTKIEDAAITRLSDLDEGALERANLERKVKRGDQIQDIGFKVKALGDFLFKGADMIERIKQKNMSVSNTVNSALNVVSGKKNKGRHK